MNQYLIIGAILLVVCIVGFYFYKNRQQVNLNTVKYSKPSKLSKLSQVEKYEDVEPNETSLSNISVLLCYANWCGHCPEVKEWYIDLVSNSPLPNVNFTMCEEQELPDEIINSIKGFPTILIFSNGQMQRYRGDRTREDLLRYLNNI